MEIKKYKYRFPNYLTLNNLKLIDSIAIHHTGNDNSIDVNTDYHMDVNDWLWLGYNYYIENDTVYEVRGYKFKGASVAHNNEHILSIAVEGNYNTKIPTQKTLDLLQQLCDYLKAEVPTIKNIGGHNKWNDTDCPGRFFPIKKIKLNDVQFATKQELEKTREDLKYLEEKFKKTIRFLEKELEIRIR